MSSDDTEMQEFTPGLDHWTDDIAEKTVKALRTDLARDHGTYIRELEVKILKLTAKAAVMMTLAEIHQILGDEAIEKINNSIYDDGSG